MIYVHDKGGEGVKKSEHFADVMNGSPPNPWLEFVNFQNSLFGCSVVIGLRFSCATQTPVLGQGVRESSSPQLFCFTLHQSELMGSLKLGNIWVFDQLIHRPTRTKNQGRDSIAFKNITKKLHIKKLQ